MRHILELPVHGSRIYHDQEQLCNPQDKLGSGFIG